MGQFRPCSFRRLPMKVYIVMQQDPHGEGSQIMGVYLDKAKADAEAAAMVHTIAVDDEGQDVEVCTGGVVEHEVIE